MTLDQLNLHHLRYFWAVARDGNLTRTARRLRVAQSALSAQIGLLEAQLGVPLFARDGRGLALTEEGRLVLGYADDIFERAGELLATLEGGRAVTQPLRVGAVATLSRNFQESFLRPLLLPEAPRAVLRLESGGLDALIERLTVHALDVVLANRPAPGAGLRSLELARQPVSLVGGPGGPRLRFPEDAERARWLVPGPESEIRRELDALCARHGVRLPLLAEVDDMATLRLLARDTDAVAVVPSIVVRDELAAGTLREHAVIHGLFERFYAVIVERRFPHPLLAPLLAQREAELLRAPGGPASAPDGSVRRFTTEGTEGTEPEGE